MVPESELLEEPNPILREMKRLKIGGLDVDSDYSGTFSGQSDDSHKSESSAGSHHGTGPPKHNGTSTPGDPADPAAVERGKRNPNVFPTFFMPGIHKYSVIYEGFCPRFDLNCGKM